MIVAISTETENVDASHIFSIEDLQSRFETN